MEQALVAAGWHCLPWCEDADWHWAWMDRAHPERSTAAQLLERLMTPLPPGISRVRVLSPTIRVNATAIIFRLRKVKDLDALT